MKSILFMKYTLFSGLIFLLFSCGDDCVTCNRNQEIMMICDDSEVNYTDVNGNPLTYEEAIENARFKGWDCQ